MAEVTLSHARQAGLIEPEDEAAETICKVARICFVCFAAELLNFKQAVEILPHPTKKKEKDILKN